MVCLPGTRSGIPGNTGIADSQKDRNRAFSNLTTRNSCRDHLQEGQVVDEPRTASGGGITLTAGEVTSGRPMIICKGVFSLSRVCPGENLKKERLIVRKPGELSLP